MTCRSCRYKYRDVHVAEILTIVTFFVRKAGASQFLTMKGIDNQYVNYSVHFQRFWLF